FERHAAPLERGLAERVGVDGVALDAQRRLVADGEVLVGVEALYDGVHGSHGGYSAAWRNTAGALGLAKVAASRSVAAAFSSRSASRRSSSSSARWSCVQSRAALRV